MGAGGMETNSPPSFDNMFSFEQQALDGNTTQKEPLNTFVVDFFAQSVSKYGVDELDKIKEVMSVVNRHTKDSLTEDEWRVYLPNWFVKKCASEVTSEEADTWMKSWKKLPWKQKTQTNDDWTLLGWLYWLMPENRVWFWHSGTAVSQNELNLKLLVDDFNFASGAFQWLCKCAGLKNIRIVNE